MKCQIFADFPDHRVTGRCYYSISDLLTIALLTYLCGGEDYVDMREFAQFRAREFGLLSENGRSPSPDTFERLMAAVSPEELDRCLREHGRSFLSDLTEKQIAIDGKQLRGSRPKARGSKGDYIMNAYVTENHLLVGQEALMDKENEIVAIPRLVERLDAEGATISIDAAGIQVEIVETILGKKAHYFLAVKDNQLALHEAVRDAFLYGRVSDTSAEMEADHGRIEERTCRIAGAENMEDTDVRGRWPGLRTIVEVTSRVTSGDSVTTSVRHYISDEDYPKAAYYAMLAREYRGIENQLHWYLDVTFHEDAVTGNQEYIKIGNEATSKIATIVHQKR